MYNFLLAHQLLALALLVVLAIFLWKKPWEFLKVAFGLLIVLAGIYVFSYLNNSAFVGAEKKHKITTEREEELFKE